MKIIKHGNKKPILFKCVNCGCEFEAEEKECSVLVNENAKPEAYVLSCPDCRKLCKHEYIEVNRIEKSVEFVIAMMNSFCMDVEETEKKHEPVFMCRKCEFEQEGYCSAKRFVAKYGTDEQKERNGCMSR